MAVRGAFSSMLIAAHRHWWKDILKLRRHSAVFSLSFDYIPNYSASKQLNEAWMLWTDSVCNWTMLLYFEHPTALILCQREQVCVRERETYVWWKRGVHEAAKPALITRVSSIRMTSSRMAWWVHDVMIWAPMSVHRWRMREAFFENSPLLHRNTITASVK